MTENHEKISSVSKGRDRAAMILMLIAALGAAFAFVSSIGVARLASAVTQQVEWWRVMGFLLFTLLFVFLAIAPRKYPGLWELILIDKGALTLIEFVLAKNPATNALSPAIIDGILTIIILAAYLLARGYTSWKK